MHVHSKLCITVRICVFFSQYFSFLFFLKKIFWRTHVLFWGHWYPCFGFLVTSPLGFKARVGSALFAIFAEANVIHNSPRSTSGATLADLLAAGAQPVTSPHACAEVGLGSDLNVQPHEQKKNALPLCQRPGFYHNIFLKTSTTIVIDGRQNTQICI